MRVPAATPDTTVVEGAAGDGTAAGEAAAEGAGCGGVSSAAARVTGAKPAARTVARTKRPGAACVRMKRSFPPGGLAFASSGYFDWGADAGLVIASSGTSRLQTANAFARGAALRHTSFGSYAAAYAARTAACSGGVNS